MSCADRKNILQGKNGEILELLFQIIQERKSGSAEKSYTVSLFQKGLDTILKKTGEEAIELVIAGKGGKREEIVYEAGDLLYHLLVLLSYYDIEPEEVYGELRRRFGVSGVAEKESRES
jgi:phosphoribosyl-ATP pyrophosphohydrolase